MVALLFACAPRVHAQTGPVVKPASLSFAYELNSKTLPASTSLAVTLTGTYASLPVKVVSSNDWLIVICDKGYAPIKCTVSVLVTGLTPGTYPATITVDTTPTHGAVTVPVVLSISNPAASLLVSSPSPYFTPATSAANASMSFAYTTAASATDPGLIEFDVASSGDSIPFDVTATSGSGSSAGWLRVSLKPTNPPAPVLHTSATVLIAGSVAVYVSVDPTIVASLDVGSYAASISVVDSNNSKDAKTLLVNLVITAGRPVLRSTTPHPIWPYTVIANPTADPVIAIYGDNFFLTSVVNVQDNTTTLSLPVKSQTLLSRQVLQVVVPKEYFTRTTGLPVWPAHLGLDAVRHQPGPAAGTDNLEHHRPQHAHHIDGGERRQLPGGGQANRNQHRPGQDCRSAHRGLPARDHLDFRSEYGPGGCHRNHSYRYAAGLSQGRYRGQWQHHPGDVCAPRRRSQPRRRSSMRRSS